MPYLTVGDTDIDYTDHGDGRPIVLAAPVLNPDRQRERRLARRTAATSTT